MKTPIFIELYWLRFGIDSISSLSFNSSLIRSIEFHNESIEKKNCVIKNKTKFDFTKFKYVNTDEKYIVDHNGFIFNNILKPDIDGYTYLLHKSKNGDINVLKYNRYNNSLYTPAVVIIKFNNGDQIWYYFTSNKNGSIFYNELMNQWWCKPIVVIDPMFIKDINNRNNKFLNNN